MLFDKNGRGHNKNTLLMSILQLQAVLPTLLMYALPTTLKERTFCCINQRKVLWGPLPNFTEKMETVLKDGAEKLNRLRDDVLLKILRENRKLVVIQLHFESFILERSDFLAMLTSKVSRNISSGVSTLRQVDSTILTSLFKFDEEIGYNKHKNRTMKRSLVHLQFDEPIHSNENKCVTIETSRRHRSVIPIKCREDFLYDDRTAYGMLGTGKRIALIYPLHSQKHHLPEMSNEDENYPVQATEIDAGQLSIGSYSPPVSNSLYCMETRRPETQHTLQATGRNYAMSSGQGLQNHVKRPRYSDYIAEVDRFSSFHERVWDSNNKPRPSDLAEWGFFYTGSQDLVRCYQCGIGLKDWAREDDVLKEHVTYSSKCSFLLQKLGKERIDQLKNSLDRPAGEPNASRSAQLQCKIRSPRYQTMEARVASFRNFPRHIHISHHQLAVAGLFFTDTGDLCRCFTCDGGLKDWSNGDDPVKEHATYFPNCTYINQLKGPEYVAGLQRSRQNHESREGAFGKSQNVQGATGSNGTSFQETETVRRSMQELTLHDDTYSSFNVSHVVQTLGYAEIDVIAARIELERKGKLNPTAEEIMNMILDIQERIRGAEPAVQTQRGDEDLQTIVEENERLSEMVHCMLCVTKEANILFLPCTHHRICQDCAKNVIFCPVCDQFIKERVKTYRS